MNLPGHRIAACLGKAALKTHALQTLPRGPLTRPRARSVWSASDLSALFVRRGTASGSWSQCTVVRPRGLSMNRSNGRRVLECLPAWARPNLKFRFPSPLARWLPPREDRFVAGRRIRSVDCPTGRQLLPAGLPALNSDGSQSVATGGAASRTGRGSCARQGRQRRGPAGWGSTAGGDRSRGQPVRPGTRGLVPAKSSQRRAWQVCPCCREAATAQSAWRP